MAYFATEDNCRLYYEEHGEGRPVVFIHGWTTNRHFFKKQVPAFAEKFHVVTYDSRGHGDSDRPETGLYLEQAAKDLKDLIEHLHLKDVVLIGWSMGAFIAWEYIRNYGCDNLYKIVTIDMSAKLDAEEDEDWPHMIFGKRRRVEDVQYLLQMARDWDSVADGFVPAMFGDGPCQDEIPWVLDMAKRNTPHCMINMYMSDMEADYRDVMEKITVPALVTYGERESLYTPESSQWVKDHIKDAELAGFDGGHIHFLQDAEHFNEVVINFIEK